MGKIQAGILSKVSGKIAGVVGADWKGIAYLRAFTKPANPNTAAQQVQRTKFSDCVEFAIPILGPVLQEYMDPFVKGMSAYNDFIKHNILEFDGSPDYGMIKLTRGTLSHCMINNASYSSSVVTITYDEDAGNNGLDSDKVFALVYHRPTKIFYFCSSEQLRNSGTITVPTVSGHTSTDYEAYLITSRLVGTKRTMVGWSDHATCIEP